LDFTNIGKKPARHGSATLFEVGRGNNWSHKRKLGEAPIIGAGTNIVPGWNGHAQITFLGEIPDLFLACVVYHDDANNILQQAFLFDITNAKAHDGGLLNEIEKPGAEACS
jgi:hypothetical protein